MKLAGWGSVTRKRSETYEIANLEGFSKITRDPIASVRFDMAVKDWCVQSLRGIPDEPQDHDIDTVRVDLGWLFSVSVGSARDYGLRRVQRSLPSRDSACGLIVDSGGSGIGGGISSINTESIYNSGMYVDIQCSRLETAWGSPVRSERSGLLIYVVRICLLEEERDRGYSRK